MSDHSSWESRKLRYWSECSGQSRRTGLRTSHPAPAASPAQARLESLVLEQLGTSPDLCAHPFGITSLSSADTSLALYLDAYMGRKRCSFPEHCLSRLLPAAPATGGGDDPHGIAGLRMSGIEADDRHLHLYMVKGTGPTATLVLALPKGLTEGWADIERRHRRWCDENGLRPLWTAPQLDGVESGYLSTYLSLEGSRARRAAVGSGLLRRIALFHTVTAFYRIQCWDDGDSWKVDARTAHPRARWRDQLLQRLCHPRWGLPVHMAHRFCRCAEPDTPTSGTAPATSTSTATPPATTTPSTCASTPAPKGTTTTGRSQHCTRSAPQRTGWPVPSPSKQSSTTTGTVRQGG
ncbi:hypothetical protein AB0I22_38040 [Streptomyces sp. NPDC050610]|uniref:hypothetical protein n=1 Tax=Streptomyces sp. NPDC050610 TaxID=3157097 RepID=UPI003447EBCF